MKMVDGEVVFVIACRCGIELPSIVGEEDVNVVYCIVRGLIMMIS